MNDSLRYEQFKSLPKRIRQGLFRFCIYGALLLAGEVAFYTITKTGRLIPLVKNLFAFNWEVDQRLALHHIWDVPIHTFFGQASLYMFAVYGAICVLGLEPANRWMKQKDFPLIFRGLVYMLIILFMECTLGWVLLFLTGYSIWFYEGPGTIFVYTSWAIAPMWFICGLISETVFNVFDSLDELKLNAYGLTDAAQGSGKRNKIVVLSDIHIGPKNANGQPAGWFYGIYEIYLTIILFKISMDRRVKELVFLGDLFDTWIYALDERPETIPEIIEKWKSALFMAPLLKCIKTCGAVYYIPGNHDMNVTQADISALTVDGKSLRVVTAGEYNKHHHLEHGTTLIMEHGNDADFFNAPDHDADTVQGFPFGYFVSRFVSAADDFDVDFVFQETYAKILGAEFVGKKGEEAEHRAGKLFIDLFVDALMVYANRKRDDGDKINNHTLVKMPDGLKDVHVSDIKEKYSSLLAAWLKDHQTYMFAVAGKNGLNRYARKKFGEKNWKLWWKRLFLNQKPELIVVMGHTHFSLQERIMNREKQGIYANTGCMCRNSKQAGVRWLELIDSPKGCSVRLKRL